MATIALVAVTGWVVWVIWESGWVLGRLYTTPPPEHRVSERVLSSGDTWSGPETVSGAGAATEETGGLATVEVAWQELGHGLLPVTGDAHPVTGQIWIGEQGGAIRILGPDGLSAPILDLSDRTEASGERGLLGIAFDVDGERLYVHLSDGNGHTDLLEFDVGQIETGSAGLPDGRTVLEVGQPRRNHNGGEVLIGPDGFLYLALGDGGGAGDVQGNAQNTSNLLGSVVRIDPTGGDPYAIPDTNPFAASGSGERGQWRQGDPRPEIWAFGLRNPFRMSFDGDGSLWIADVGQRSFEEISRIPPGTGGANLGWNEVEGFASFEGGSAEGLSDYVEPVHVYNHGGDRCSVTGGRVYRGDAIPALRGSYLYGDFCEQILKAFEIDDPGTDRSLEIGLDGGPTAFIETADREIIALTLSGQILKLVPDE